MSLHTPSSKVLLQVFFFFFLIQYNKLYTMCEWFGKQLFFNILLKYVLLCIITKMKERMVNYLIILIRPLLMKPEQL